MSLLKILARYVLEHELKRSSEAQMATVLKVFLNWIGVSDLPVEQFTADRISEFLLAKQRDGRSSQVLRRQDWEEGGFQSYRECRPCHYRTSRAKA